MNQTLLNAGTVLVLLYTVTAVTLIAHWVYHATRKPDYLQVPKHRWFKAWSWMANKWRSWQLALAIRPAERRPKGPSLNPTPWLETVWARQKATEIIILCGDRVPVCQECGWKGCPGTDNVSRIRQGLKPLPHCGPMVPNTPPAPAKPLETRYGVVQIMRHGQPWTPKDNFLQGLRGSIRTKAEHYWDAAPGSTAMGELNAYKAMAIQEQAQRDAKRQISKKKHRKQNGKAKKRL